MKIAYLINQYPGISHSFVRREIQALERRGLEIARFAVRPSKTKIIAGEDLEEQAKTRAIVGTPPMQLVRSMLMSLIGAPLAALQAFGLSLRLGARSEAGLLRHLIYYAEALVLAQWLRTRAISHVHAHFGTNSATVAMLASHITGGRFSLTVHGPEEFDKPGLISLRDKIERAAFVVAISSYGRSQLRRLVSAALWDKIKIVHCGIEDAFFAGEIAPLPDNTTFVSVGRLSEQKGQMTILEAAAKLKQRTENFRVVLVGDGELRPTLELATDHFGIRDQITFAGWKTPSEVRREIENARVFLLPSFAEGLPVSIMEAFLLERPVLSTYIAGIPELVQPGVNGWLTPASDADALADAMETALNTNVDSLKKMAAKGKTRTLARHHIDDQAKILHDLFTQYKDEHG